MSIKIADFFCGVGGIRSGFHNASKDFECVFSNDIDANAIKTYEANFSCKVNNLSITELANDTIQIPDFDIFLGGFPCQPFSIAGEKKGFDDERGNLFFDIVKILEEKKPKAFFLENVKNLKSHDKGNTYKIISSRLRKAGYFFKSKIMNTSEYANIPQNRERIFIVGFRDLDQAKEFKFPAKLMLTKSISHFLEDSIPDKYYYSDKSAIYDKLVDAVTENVENGQVYQYRRHYVRENKSKMCPTLTANMGGGGHNVPIIKDDRGIRKLTPRECFSLQGFPLYYTLPNIADSHLYKQAGNSVTVKIITRIAKEMKKVL
jgi:DNA (cytosine-5)-methyltransferase 1